MAVDKNKHLNDSLDSHKISKEQDLLDKHVEKRKEISEALMKRYGSDMYSPLNSGSYAKHTAMNKKFDIDLVAPYKRSAFDTLEEMYNSVHDFLHDKYKNEATVRKQKVSIGLEFYADDDGDIIKVDVVPGRELSKDQYPKDDNLNLYVYEQFGKIDKGSDRIKSNIKAQIENVKSHAEKDSVRKMIKLLKVWKFYNNKKPKSFFLELITIKAFDKKTISGNTWDMLEAVMEYIRDEVKTVSLPDPGNSSNDIADTLTDSEKKNVSDDMKWMLERIEENSDFIKTYYPINDKFPPEEDKFDNSYKKKDDSGISVPPPVRFG